MKAFVIYTVITGNYENVLQPMVVDDRFDYILFSNDRIESPGIWSVRSIPDVVRNDNKRLSRYPKTHPETLLSEYQASLYIDANIQILDKWVYDRFLELFDKSIDYAGIKLVLTERDCIYEHTLDMCLWRLEYPSTAVRQCNALYKSGFPRHFGLNENNVIFRTHSDRMRAADEEWWQWITTYSSRDQFSYMFCLWKHNIAIHYFLPAGEDTRNSSRFKLINHDGSISVKRTKLVRLGVIRRLFLKSLRDNPQLGIELWRRIYEASHPIIRLYALGGLQIIKNSPRFISSAFQGLFR